MYNKINSAQIEQLCKICGEANVLFGDMISVDYGHDELGGIEKMPDVLVRAGSDLRYLR